jgi:hypothetical protein
MSNAEPALYHAECAILTLLCGGAVVWALYRRLARTRPGFGIGGALIVAMAARVVAAVAVDALGSTGTRLRGPDDGAFFQTAEKLGHVGLTDSAWRHTDLHGVTLALPIRILGDPGALTLRFLEVALVIVGITLIGAAVYDLAGSSAAKLVAWVLALEPTSVFFSSFLHKEALMILGEGLVAFGSVLFLRRRRNGGLAAVALGLFVVAAARPYAAVFLGIGAALVCFHATVRRFISKGRVLPAILACILLVALLVATGVWSVQAGKLDELQRFQNVGGANSNLALEPVDFTTVSGVVEGLPLRVRDFLMRPYPWEQANLSQRLGAGGTLLTWLLFLTAIVGVALNRRRARAALVVFGYLIGAVILGYALTTANAGTGFRHRVNVLLLLTAVVAIVWSDRAGPLWERVGRIDPLRRLRSRADATAPLARARGFR